MWEGSLGVKYLVVWGIFVMFLFSFFEIHVYTCTCNIYQRTTSLVISHCIKSTPPLHYGSNKK